MALDYKKVVTCNATITDVQKGKACAKYGPKITDVEWVTNDRNFKVGEKVFLYKIRSLSFFYWAAERM